MPVTGGTSSGLGRKSSTASSIGWMPLFLSADPHRTGMIRAASVPARSAVTIRVDLVLFEVAVRDLVIDVRERLDQPLVPGRRLRGQLGGNLPDLDLVAQVIAVRDRLHVD